MLKRTLLFTSPVYLSLKNEQLVVCFKDTPDDKRTIPIEDIGFVLIDNPMISITMPLVNALADNNVALIFCNEKSMPNAMLQNLDTHSLQCEILNKQIAIGEVLKKNLWKQTIEAKIKNQSKLLMKLGKDGNVLKPYYSNVKSGDADNREGAAARIYWMRLFGNDFVRDRNFPGINSLLNYGYTILRAATTRALMGSGLLPAIGIFHHNRSNAFPLADDIMEPYRPYVDEIVYGMFNDGMTELNQKSKSSLLHVLFCDTHFSKVTRPLSIALTMTSASLVKCFSREMDKISYPLMKI